MAHVRVSTERQAEHETSLNEQETGFARGAAERGYEIVETYVEAGRSGMTDRRPALQRMIADACAQPKKYNAVFVCNFPRFFRDEYECEGYRQQAGEGGRQADRRDAGRRRRPTRAADPQHLHLARRHVERDQRRAGEGGDERQRRGRLSQWLGAAAWLSHLRRRTARQEGQEEAGDRPSRATAGRADLPALSRRRRYERPARHRRHHQVASRAWIHPSRPGFPHRPDLRDPDS
ncbi:recombinase family protein [Sphingomonas hankookensis]|uniref:Resolvase/invertase-type recombinase catalytic domain-containing protein n=1 Tax=Sphingomonas hengshuiensis TaxID=1609977 RepID=A0A2W4Z3E9_9SPHN|nr:MAG: hypothetical protein DI632_09775 [Sphingomonas hengshuiensis]